MTDLYVDAHPSLRQGSALRPFQRFTLALDGMTVHPDLVGRVGDGERTVAIEAKGADDLLRGLAQASAYRFGFHQVFLACAGPAPADLVVMARAQHVGVLEAYAGRVVVTHLPPAHLPLLHHAQSIQRQFATTQTLRSTFVFNVPTHYLSIPLAVNNQVIAVADLERQLRVAYPVLPAGSASFAGALRGAQQLGLVAVRGDIVAPTQVGRCAAQLLPDLATLSAIHATIARPPRTATLASASPAAGAVLRWLLAHDPVAELIVAVLTGLGGEPVAMPELVRVALAHDRAQALAVFFNPETLDEITDASGQVRWEAVTPAHYRSTTFMQVKSILKHAGILAPHPLGGASSRSFLPATDRWELLAVV